eukprot:g3018.t1
MLNSMRNESKTGTAESSGNQQDNSRLLQILNHRLRVQHRKELKDAVENKLLDVSTISFNASHEIQARIMELFNQEVNCPSLRHIGGYGMDGRWICGFDTFLSDKKQCIVYSFAKNITNLEMEIAFLKETSCQVHLFDPFLHLNKLDELTMQYNAFYHHNSTLAAREDVNYLFDELRPDLSSIQEWPLDHIMHDMGHSWVDVVKFDFHGDDSEIIRELLLGELRKEKIYHKKIKLPIGQLLFRMVTGREPARIVELLVPLMNCGLSVFHFEPNLRAQFPWEDVFFSMIHVDSKSKFVIHRR